MKNYFLFISLLISASFFTGCSAANYVRHRYDPPKRSDSPKPENTKQTMKAATEILRTKAREIADASFPLKINPKAKVKGRTLIIDKSRFSVGIKGFDYNGEDYYQLDLDKFGLKKEDLAVKPEEIDTAILKSCEKGKQIGQYALSDGKKIPAFALDCKVSIIDYRNAAIVAEKKFPSNGMYDDIMTSKSTKEWIAGEPTGIDEYIKNFPRE